MVCHHRSQECVAFRCGLLLLLRCLFCNFWFLNDLERLHHLLDCLFGLHLVWLTAGFVAEALAHHLHHLRNPFHRLLGLIVILKHIAKQLLELRVFHPEWNVCLLLRLIRLRRQNRRVRLVDHLGYLRWVKFKLLGQVLRAIIKQCVEVFFLLVVRHCF